MTGGRSVECTYTYDVHHLVHLCITHTQWNKVYYYFYCYYYYCCAFINPSDTDDECTYYNGDDDEEDDKILVEWWQDGERGNLHRIVLYTHTHRHCIHTTKQILLLLSIRSLIASKYYLKKTSISTPTTTTQHHNTAALCDHVCPVFCAGMVDGSAHRKLLVVFP